MRPNLQFELRKLVVTFGAFAQGLPRRLARRILAFGLICCLCVGGASGADSASTAIFAGEDSATQGNWKTRYGLDGFEIIGDSRSYPACAEVRTTNSTFFAWTTSTTEGRAPARASGPGRVAATWFANNGFSIDLSLTDGKPHRVSFYLLDWDRKGRVEEIEVLDQAGRLLDNRFIQSFEEGKYLKWDIQGHVTIRFTARGADNAVLSGLFFDAGPSPTVKSDFDRDGKSDLLFQDANGFLAVWFLNEGTRGAVYYLSSARYLSPDRVDEVGDRLAATGDFNGDGDEDILFQRPDGGLKIWQMNGTFRLNAQAVDLIPNNPGDNRWRIFDAADVNNDRKVDLLFQHADGTLAVWFMDGVRLSSSAVLTLNRPLDASWRAVGVGKSGIPGNTELVMQHDSGIVEVWFFDGTRQNRSGPLGQPYSGPQSSVASVVQLSKYPNIKELVFQRFTYDLSALSISGTNVYGGWIFSPMNPSGTWSVMGRLLPGVGYNSPPVISLSVMNQVTDRDLPTPPISFYVRDKETATAALVVTATSSNPTLVPNDEILLSGSGEWRTVSIRPLPGQQGIAAIALTVTDLGVPSGAPKSASTSFTLTVRGNQAPTISSLADQTIPMNASTPELIFSVGDAETPAANLSVTGQSSNPELVPFGSIRFSGTGAVRSVKVSPQTNRFGTAMITVTVNDGSGGTASTSFTVKVAGRSRAEFVEVDLDTQGDWTARYGRDSFSIPEGSFWFPSGVQTTVARNSTYAWAPSTGDVRGLIKQGFWGHRYATCWFANQSLEFDVSIPDGQARRLALYFVDWDSFDRSQTVEILNTAGVQVLDTRVVNGFHEGKYLVWEVEGHVTIRIHNTGGSNVVLSGLFVDLPPTVFGDSWAAFVSEDTQTQGEWSATYGREGYNIVRGGTQIPSFAKVSVEGAREFTWTDPSAESEALRKADNSDRLAACWFADQSFDVRLDFADPQPHRVSFYFLDYVNPEPRAQRIEILDSSTGEPLSARTVSNFRAGKYLVWDIRGSVLVRVSTTNKANAVLSGLFFDRAPHAAKGDFDGDGRSDLVWQDANGAAYAWLMNGVNRREQTQLGPAGSGDPQWRLAGTADFNRDGQTDVVWQHSDGWSAIWFMRGVRLDYSRYTVPSMIGNKEWQIVATGDFDRDQIGDIVWQRENGPILVWFMNEENSTRAARIDPSQPSEPGLRVVATGDFDGDKKLDLVLQSDSGGPGKVWYLDGQLRRIRQTSMTGGVGQGWRIVGAGDFQENTRVDVLWQFAGGETAVWLMNEATQYSGVEFNPRRPDNPNWKLAGPK
ncbi:MAG: VCBS repeat-containing protein [Verrucomicrobia bacterium]|nr:VCBS repeat-containing protein [Verrucomicrobiota bacterium]